MMKKIMINAVSAVLLVVVLTTTSMPFGLSENDADWSNTAGDMGSPWISDAMSPTTGVRVLWRDSGSIESMTELWKVPSTAICVGSYTYYAEMETSSSAAIHKVNTADGTEVGSQSYSTSNMTNIPLAYGDGTIYAPSFNGLTITIVSFDSGTLESRSTTFPSLPGGNLSQGPITFYDGKLFIGTYEGDFACFDMNGVELWRISECRGWYNATPAFMTVSGTEYCFVCSRGYAEGGAKIFAVNMNTNAITCVQSFTSEYMNAGATCYEGRIYVVTQTGAETGNKTTHVKSFAVGSGGALSGMKSWTSSEVGGSQSVPVIFNDRIYLGSGGEVARAARPIEVLSIDTNDNMSLAYSIPVYTKCTLSLTTAYYSETGRVYLYCVPYEKNVLYYGSQQDLCIISDCAGQTVANYTSMDLASSEYCYQSVTISPEGYLLVRTDNELICCTALPHVLGDATGDGKITNLDKLRIARSLVFSNIESEQLGELAYQSVDINGDGRVTNLDKLFLAQYLIGLRDTLVGLD